MSVERDIIDKLSQGERVFHQPECPEWGDEMITTDDLTDNEVKELKKNIADIKARRKHD